MAQIQRMQAGFTTQAGLIDGIFTTDSGRIHDASGVD
jgi:hypothetical protein